ncbi:MAG TPA: carbohydrate ABC transporter permease [Trueperaceae bacterium]|nr:carbohydrate ABC transporter permease [Trueperaceae bacterium]
MSRRYGWRTFALEVVLIAFAAIFLFPIYVLFVQALKTPSELATSPLSLPTRLYFGNFVEAWTAARIGPALVSSFIITGTTVLLLVVLGSMGAYVLARRKSRLGDGLFQLLLLGIIVPFQLALIPLYQLVKNFGLLGTYPAMILFHTGGLVPLAIFLYVGFLRSTTSTYEEAALIDGANHLQTFALVVFPLLRPVTGTVIILSTIIVWNDFLTPLLYLSGSGKQTVPVAIYSFVGQYVSQWHLIFAGLIIGTAPILIAFFLLQHTVIKGFSSGLKG